MWPSRYLGDGVSRTWKLVSDQLDRRFRGRKPFMLMAMVSCWKCWRIFSVMIMFLECQLVSFERPYVGEVLSKLVSLIRPTWPRTWPILTPLSTFPWIFWSLIELLIDLTCYSTWWPNNVAAPSSPKLRLAIPSSEQWAPACNNPSWRSLLTLGDSFDLNAKKTPIWRLFGFMVTL